MAISAHMIVPAPPMLPYTDARVTRSSYFSVDWIRVDHADTKNNLYRGWFEFTDFLEGGTGAYEWFAHPGKEYDAMHGRPVYLDVIPIDPFWSAHQFTLLDNLDVMLKHRVRHAVLDVNPQLNLPHSQVRLETLFAD